MQFKYFSEAWCCGGTVRREEAKDALGEQRWGTGVSTSKTRVPLSRPATGLHCNPSLAHCE